jgi:Rrf2 family protein
MEGKAAGTGGPLITKRAKYALKALLHLAEHGRTTPCQTRDIAEKCRIPRKFLEQILLDLRNRGLVRSHQGRGGGFTLAKDPREISLTDALRLVDGPMAPLPCLSKTAYAPCDDCEDEENCGVRRLFLEAYGAMLERAEGQTLADGIADPENRRAR